MSGRINKGVRRFVLGSAKAVLLMAFVGTGIAQTVAASPVQTPKPDAEAKPASSDSATKQGIKVSGWWTIQVKDPDGKVMERREFENSLQGSELLPALLLNLYTAGQPVIQFSGNNTLACGTNNPACSMTMLSSPATFFGCSTAQGCETNLKATPHYTPNANAGKADGLTLAGSITVTGTGEIIFVQTAWRFCAHGPDLPSTAGVKSATTPASCAAETPMGTDVMRTSALTVFTFGGTGDQAPIHVTAGQIVQVSVLLTFS